MNRIQNFLVVSMLTTLSPFLSAQIKLPGAKPASSQPATQPSRFVRTADGRTDVIGAYKTLADLQAAYDSNTIERYSPRDVSGAGRYPHDGVNVRAEEVKVVTFALLSILEGRAWVAYYPGDKLRYSVQKDGTNYPVPFADDRCGNKIFEIAYPTVQKAVPPPVQAQTTVIERVVERTPITIIVQNEVKVAAPQCPPAPVLQAPRPTGPVLPAPLPQGPAIQPSLKEVGVPQAGFQPVAPVLFNNGNYEKKWSVGKKWAVGLSIGLPVAFLVAKSLSHKDSAPADQKVTTH